MPKILAVERLHAAAGPSPVAVSRRCRASFGYAPLFRYTIDPSRFTTGPARKTIVWAKTPAACPQSFL